MNIIKQITKYPIKGLSGENLQNVLLQTNQVLPGDREFAFARSNVNYDPENPIYLKKTNFLALVKEEKLAKLKTEFNSSSQQLKIKIDNQVVLNQKLINQENISNVESFFQKYLNLSNEEKPMLVRGMENKTSRLKHSFSDLPDKAISIINLKSIKDFESKLDRQISPTRFRANFLIDGNEPWEEFNWIGKEITLGSSILKVFKRTQRCGATNVNPENAERDINIPNEIKNNYGHFDLGVYAQVIKSGLVSINDSLEIK